ncbi:MAG: MFS transporter [Vulcanimicrobiaceae bacterium]
MILAARSAPRAAERRAVVAIAFAAVAVFADAYITQPLLPILGTAYGVSPAVAGGSVSAVVLAMAISSSAYGPLGDFLGRKPIMVVGCGLLALATFACAFAPDFRTLVLLRALQGLLIPSVSAVAVAYLGDLRGGRDLGSLVGLYIGATVSGGFIGRVGSGLIAGTWSWRASFVAYGVLTSIAAVGLAVALRRRARPRDRNVGRAFAAAYGAMGRHIGDARLLGGFIAGAMLFFGFIGVFTYLPYLLVAPPFSLSTGTVAFFYAAYVAGIVTAPIAGGLSQRFSRRAIVAAGFIIALAGLALTAITALWAIVAGVIVLCVGMFAAQAVAPAYVNVTARVAKGGANALYQAFYYGGAVLGSTLPGLGWEWFGWPGVLATCASGMAVGLVAFLALAREDASR